MKKKTLSLALAFLIFLNILTTPAAALAANNTINITPGWPYAAVGGVPASRLREYYSLTGAEKRLYDQIATGIANLDMRITVDFPLRNISGAAALKKIARLVHYIHPEFFWWTGTYTYKFVINGKSTVDGDYSILPVYEKNGKEICAKFNRAKNQLVWPAGQEITELKYWVNQGVTALHNELENLLRRVSAMTPHEKELAVHDWLCDRITYDKNAPNRHTVYGAIIERRATCAGYSGSFQYILRLLGVECLTFSGIVRNREYPNGEYHAWSAVKLYGEWYQVDVTGDDNDAHDLPWHFHFNRTTKFFTGLGYNHVQGSVLNPNITCTATQYDYYNMTDSHIASDSDFISNAPARIAKAKANRERAFELEFDPSYAMPSEINTKLKLVDPGLAAGIEFLCYDSHALLLGVFK
ncbi:MAG: transglutaminase-like domain-containing protein [Synergistaceae bacterium]|nr:transglutaminase-like domain-containing protein [Synergistaceae bacterium]